MPQNDAKRQSVDVVMSHQKPRECLMRRNCKGFAIIDLLIVIAIIAVLVGLILPSVQLLRTSAERSQCQNNLHNIGVAYGMTQEPGSSSTGFKGDDDWPSQLARYLDSQASGVKLEFTCPSPTPLLAADGVPPVSQVSYGINNACDHFNFNSDTGKILALEYRKRVASIVGNSASDFWPQQYAARHNGVLNVLFQDGSVQNFTPNGINPMYAAVMRHYWVPEVLAD
jgi:prepilin-type processing-associated H-X9-DG protein